MQRKAYYLPSVLLDRLKKFAANKDKPMSEIVRQAIEEFLSKHR